MKSLWKRMESLDSALRKKRAELLALLKENAHLEIRDLRFPIFSALCDTLYDAAKDWHGYSKENDFPFYLWPGYDTIRVREGEPQRVQLRMPMTELFGRIGGEGIITCGVSPHYPVPAKAKLQDALEQLVENRREGLKDRLPNHDNYHLLTDPGLITWDAEKPQFRVLINPASAFFTVLLTDLPSPEEPGAFIPGSTHRWLSEFDLHIGEMNGPSPRGLIVNYETGATTVQDAFLSINLKGRLDDAGPRIGTFLDKWVKARTKWPAVLSGSDDQMSQLNLRRALYTPWLMAVFAPDTATNTIDTALELLTPTFDDSDNLKRRRELLQGTVESLRDIDDHAVRFIIEWSSYRHWYSLVLDNALGKLVLSVDGTLDRTDQVSLGTVMLFSGKPLGHGFLTVVRNWLQEVLLLLRESEGSTAAVEAGELKQAFDQYSAISHEFKDIVPLISKANGKPFILEQFQYWLLEYSLPAFSKLEEQSLDTQLPVGITGKGIADFYQWLTELTSAAAGVQALVIPRQIPATQEMWNQWVTAITKQFSISEDLKGLTLPQHFPTRCLLAICYVCALRNAIKHSFTRRGASNPAPLYRWKGDEKIRIAIKEQQIPGWPSTVLTISNFAPENAGSHGLDGTAGAISFYLSELMKCLKIEEAFPLEPAFANSTYSYSLPLISGRS